MFGAVLNTPQNEETPFNPRSTYGISKVTGFQLVKHYREAYNIFAVSGILFNHESERRGMEFVTRKISSGVAKIKNGLINSIELGNLKAERDWGHASDYVRAMWMMLQQDNPQDFVIGTGITNTVEEFARLAFNEVGLDYKKHIIINKDFYRPSEVDTLIADFRKAKNELKWEPEINFNELVKLMVKSDLEKFK